MILINTVKSRHCYKLRPSPETIFNLLSNEALKYIMEKYFRWLNLTQRM